MFKFETNLALNIEKPSPSTTSSAITSSSTTKWTKSRIEIGGIRTYNVVDRGWRHMWFSWRLRTNSVGDWEPKAGAWVRFKEAASSIVFFSNLSRRVSWAITRDSTSSISITSNLLSTTEITELYSCGKPSKITSKCWLTGIGSPMKAR